MTSILLPPPNAHTHFLFLSYPHRLAFGFFCHQSTTLKVQHPSSCGHSAFNFSLLIRYWLPSFFVCSFDLPNPSYRSCSFCRRHYLRNQSTGPFFVTANQVCCVLCLPPLRPCSLRCPFHAFRSVRSVEMQDCREWGTLMCCDVLLWCVHLFYPPAHRHLSTLPILPISFPCSPPPLES